jgi:parallel beta-helix repeat protein
VSFNINIHAEPIKPIYTSHNPIYISGNSDFTSANGVVSGSGTSGNPYIIENWTINASGSTGISVYGTDAHFIIRNCHIHSGGNWSNSNIGIIFNYVENAIIKNNIINYNYYGIHLYKSDYNKIENNTISNNRGMGSRIEQSDSNTIINNTCDSNGYGFYIEDYSNYNSIEQNKFRQSTSSGIYIYRSEFNYFINNTISKNKNDGIYNRYSSNNTISNNTINSNSDEGINIYSSSNDLLISNNTVKFNNIGITFSYYSKRNLVYNNYFENNNNCYYSNGADNYWNITKTAGKNIVGGPYLGGNFWSDYQGYDLDLDRIGDTKIPYGPGDRLPLVTISKPKIVDHTEGDPKTGDEFIVELSVYCSGIVDFVYLEYRFDDGPNINKTMSRIAGNKHIGNYSLTLEVPDYSFYLYYFASAENHLNQWNCMDIIELEVIDNDAPIIQDNTDLYPSNSENFTFNYSVTDNIEVSTVNLEYWFDLKEPHNVSMVQLGEFYELTIKISDSSEKLYYFASAADKSSNWASQKYRILKISDIIPPIINDNSGVPTTGDNYSFEFEIIDNLKILSAKLEYWFDFGEHVIVDILGDFRYDLVIPQDAFELNAVVTAFDTSGNKNELKILKEIIDNDKPEIEDLTYHYMETGEDQSFIFDIIENRKLETAHFTYWINGDEIYSGVIDGVNDRYEFKIQIPENATVLNYSLFAKDTSNNLEMVSRLILVKDSIPPTILNLSSNIPTTGELFNVTGLAIDNIEVDQFRFSYWFDDILINDISFSEPVIIQVPNNARKYKFEFFSNDTSGNYIYVNKTGVVLDNDAPTIKCNLTNLTTGDDGAFFINLYDNIQVAQGIVKYNFDTGETENRVLDSIISIIPIKIPLNATIFNFTITAEDTNGNINFENDSVPVLDNDPPGFLDLSMQKGKSFEFLVSPIDNINVSTMKLRYWLKDGLVKTLVLVIDNGTCYERIKLTTQDKRIYYLIEVEDSSGNTAISDEVYVDIIWPDNKVMDTTDINEYQFGIIAILFIVIMLIIVLIIIIIIRRSGKSSLRDFEQEASYDTYVLEPEPDPKLDQEPETDEVPIKIAPGAEDINKGPNQKPTQQPTQDTEQDPIDAPDSQDILEELADDLAVEVEPVRMEPNNSPIEPLVEKPPMEEENIQYKEEQIITDIKPEQAEQTIENVQTSDQTMAIPVVEKQDDVVAETHVAPLAKPVDNNGGNNSGEN